MSAIDHSTTQDTIHEMRCTNCDNVLPPQATFCGVCGERVQKDARNAPASQLERADITERYRITSLVHRGTFTQVLLALDTMHQRPVIVRDIDISSLDDAAKKQAIEAVQREYDLLRRKHIPDVMPLIDLRYSREHLFAVAGWPFPLAEDTKSGGNKAATATLQDVLQSGIGLPGEYKALVWLYRLSGAMGHLHGLDIILGDLDPSAVVLSENTYNSTPALMVSWIPLPIRVLLSQTTSRSTNESLFMAPEALHGKTERRSDIYSLGALLYLLLTGSAPDELSVRAQRPWRGLRDTSPRVSGSTEAIVMRALSTDPALRFQRVEEMEESLLLALEQSSEARKIRSAVQKKGKSNVQKEASGEPKDDAEEVTISIVSLQSQLARWQLEKIQAKEEYDRRGAERGPIADTPTISTAHIRDALLKAQFEEPQPVDSIESQETGRILPLIDSEPMPEPIPRGTTGVMGETSGTTGEIPLMQRFRERISGILPALPRVPKQQAGTAPIQAPQKEGDISLFKRFQRFLLGEQHHMTTAAALIETPLRIQPNQAYTIRLHLLGRDTATLPHGAKKGAEPVGLSAVVHGEVVHIEVRSAIFQNYAYIVQQADVHVPDAGFAAEVTIPMQPLSEGPSGRRERLHIFFMDEQRRPLYEKPFAVEVFVSHLVQAGREGHNVLTIPL